MFSISFQSPPNQDPEAQTPSSARLVLLNARARRVTTITTLTLLLTSLAIVGIGIIGGTYLYRQYLRAQIFKGWCNIPYDEEKAAMFIGTKIDDEDHKMDDSKLFKPLDDVENFQTIVSNYFQEQFELDLENEKFEKIDVPDFRDGRSGRFIHDFNTNKTCIIDVSEKRCFVMPLNRDRVLPPRSMFDLIQKMWDGYYKVNTTVVRENMRVVLPPITDMSEIGDYIERECYGMLIYKLEKDDSKGM